MGMFLIAGSESSQTKLTLDIRLLPQDLKSHCQRLCESVFSSLLKVVKIQQINLE